MNIKRLTLLAASGLIAIAGVLSFQTSQKEVYFPRSETYFTVEQQLADGYQEYMKTIRNNRTTGFISAAEVQAARTKASKMAKNNKSLNINWRFKGPDNVGGRTRAIVIDRNDTNHLYAGGVSGGIWESFDGAQSWQPYDKDFKIMNVSCMAQASDGSIYVGTGNAFDGNFNNKSKGSHFVGTGLYKLTGNGNSDLLVGPASPNTFSEEWSYINDVEVDPSDPDHILAAMDRGLRESTDGGVTWTSLINVTNCLDVEITSDGTIHVAYFGSIYRKTPSQTNFTRTDFSGAGRIELAVAPSDESILYAGMARSNRCVFGVYRSNDAGASWSRLANTPPYFNNGISCQGFYDNEIVVFPNNPGKIIVGGITLYVWNQSSVDPAPIEGEWKILATLNEFNVDNSRNPFYVHADKHKFVFNPENPNTLFLGTDGGVSVSFNIDARQPTFSLSNLGFNITQFYDIGIGPNDQVAGGTQDNGTQLVGLPFNTGKSAVEVRGGDGFDTELFTINPTLGIASLYFGDIRRLQGVGTTLQETNPDNASIYSGSLLNICGGEGGGRFNCSPTFYTSTSKWESFNHTETKDSVIVQLEEKSLPPKKASTIIPYNSKNNRVALEGLLTKDEFPRDTLIGDIKPATELVNNNDVSTIVTEAFDTLAIDLINDEIRVHLRGQGRDTFPVTFGQNVTYSNVFVASDAGPNLKVKVNATPSSNGGDTNYTAVFDQAQVTFYYEFEFPDIVQSMVSLANVRGRAVAAERNVWITKDVLKGGDIRWFKVAGRGSTPSPMPFEDALANEFSRDGNHLFIGTDFGKLMRIDNLNDIDVSQIPITADDELVSRTITNVTLAGSFGNRAVTGIAIDPNNANNVIVTLGNYGGLGHVRRSTNALSANPIFEPIDGVGANELPDAPAYDAVIDRRNPNRVLIGTEFGVFGTDNAFETATVTDPNTGNPAIDVRWTEENLGMGQSPVYAIKQMVFGPTEGAINEGKVYVGTHGRGIFETDQLVGVNEFISRGDRKSIGSNLVVYPNPVRDNAKLDINVVNPSLVSIQVYSLSGQLVMTDSPANLNKGDNIIQLNVNDLKNGTYLIRLIDGDKAYSGKFIKQ
ncbi:MAG: T9SS type A sorting domain-containing protein [Vicingaceae bacterium]